MLLHADASNIGQVTQDLRTDGFYVNEDKQTEIELLPGDSTFVSCVECIQLPNDLTTDVYGILSYVFFNSKIKT